MNKSSPNGSLGDISNASGDANVAKDLAKNLGLLKESSKHTQLKTKNKLNQWRKSSTGFYTEITAEGEIEDKEKFSMAHFYYTTPVGE
jgi:hypothetical protein